MFELLPDEIMDDIICHSQEDNPISLLSLRDVNNAFRKRIDSYTHYYKGDQSWKKNATSKQMKCIETFCKKNHSINSYKWLLNNDIQFNLSHVQELIICDRHDVIHLGFSNFHFLKTLFNRFYLDTTKQNDIFSITESNNPLIVAGKHNRIKIVRLLLEYSDYGNPYIKMIPGLLDLAIKHNNKQLANYVITNQFKYIDTKLQSKCPSIIHRIHNCEDLIYYLLQTSKVSVSHKILTACVYKKYTNVFEDYYDDCFDRDSTSLLKVCFETSNSEILQIIMDKGIQSSPYEFIKRLLSRMFSHPNLFHKSNYSIFEKEFIYTILNNYLDYLDKQIPIILICIQNEISINTIEILAENKFSYGFEEILEATKREDISLLRVLVNNYVNKNE